LSMSLAHCPSCANYMVLLGDPGAFRKGSDTSPGANIDADDLVS
jgi:hypothetical protein